MKKGQNVRVRDLLMYDNEIRTWANQNSLLFHFNFGKIQQFQKENNVRIRGINDRLRTLDMEYYQHDMVDGEPVYKYEGEGKERKPMLKEGKTAEEANKALQDFLNEETVVFL